MDENTTTEAPVESGAQDALPEATEQAPAVAETNDQSATESTSSGEEQSSLPDIDEKLKKYADTHGLELDSENTIKAAKIAMQNQAEFHRSRQQQSELKKSMEAVADSVADEEAAVTGENPETARLLKRLLVRDSLRDFWDNNPEAREHEEQLAKIVSDRPHLAGDLEAAYALVQTQTLKSEGKKEALTTLASKQRAAAPAGSAVSSAPTQSSITRAEISRRTQSGDLAWLDKNRDKINQLVSDGKLQ